MISKFLREQKRYTQKDLCDILECSEEKTVLIIRKLKEYGILKAVKASNSQSDMSELIEDDLEVADVELGEKEYLYVCTFVGVITVAGIVLKCYPKYLLNVDEPKEELKQVLKVLEKYNAKKQIIRMFNDSSESQSFNLLAVLLFLLNDYYENGVYSNVEDIIETNGSGEILWERTINDTFTLLNNNRPYYIELQTIKNVVDETDYFKRLHECILSIASKELKEADLLDLFEITEVELSDEELLDFGDTEYILYRIENELNVQFNTRKQLLLKTLYTYISNCGNLQDIECISMFGTNGFNLVWESVCADVMDNKLEIPLSLLKLPVPLNEKYDGKAKLVEIIEKPYWSITNQTANDTLIPDLISIIENNGIYHFIIFDAKYYNALLEDGIEPKGQPGIEAITKQYLYQLAYKDFVEEHSIPIVKNCFLMPTEKEEIIDKGFVSLNMLEKMGLEKIQVRLLPAKKIYDYYLNGKKIDINELKILNENLGQLSTNFEYDIFKQNEGRFKTINGRNIYYYGEEFGDIIKVIKNKYEKIKTLNDLFNFLLEAWSKEKGSKENNPTCGQGYITSKIVYELFGGTVHKISVNETEEHYFNKIDGHYIDLTRDQYDLYNIPINYEFNNKIE